MELLVKVDYASVLGSLYPGETTEGKNYPEEKKQQMLTDFPDWFEVIPEEVPAASEGSKKNKAKV